MRLIGVIDDPKPAQQLSAFLLPEGIENRIDLDEYRKSEIWVKDEDQFKTASEAFEQHQSNPADPKYAQSVEAAIKLVKQRQQKARSVQKNMVKVKHGPTPTLGPIVKTIIGLTILVAILTNFGARETAEQGANRALQFVAVEKPLADELTQQYGFKSDSLHVRLASLKRGEFWRLLTPIFIHYGVMHLVFNVIMFFQFGKMVEGRYGSMRIAILILVCAVLSNFAQGVVPTQFGGSPANYYRSGMLISSFGGLSGVVFGLFGFILVKQSTDATSGFFLPQSTIMFLLIYMVFCMTPLAPAIGLNIANWAHGIGFLVGCGMALVNR